MHNPQILAGKRILFALCGFDLGGAERQALYLACYLKNIGCDVRVWGHHHQYPGPERVIEKCETADIPWSEYKFRWPCGKAALVRDSFRLLKGLYRESPDVILSYTTWPNIGCGLLWRWSPAKVSVWGQRDLVPLKNNWIERLAYRGTSGVICNANHEIDYLNRLFGETRLPIHVVYNGIKLDLPQKTRAQWRAELGIPEDSIVVTMLANFRLDKDHSTLLHAWRKILNALRSSEEQPYLILAGALQESTEYVESLVSDLCLGDRVSLPGQIGDVAGFLSACDIGILCTHAEGLPNAVLEYMICGLPVVVTDIPGNREALGDDSDDQFCRVSDPDSLANRLQVLFDNPELRKIIGVRNRQRAETVFSIDKMCKKTVSIIESLLENNSKHKRKSMCG